MREFLSLSEGIGFAPPSIPPYFWISVSVSFLFILFRLRTKHKPLQAWHSTSLDNSRDSTSRLSHGNTMTRPLRHHIPLHSAPTLHACAYTPALNTPALTRLRLHACYRSALTRLLLHAFSYTPFRDKEWWHALDASNCMCGCFSVPSGRLQACIFFVSLRLVLCRLHKHSPPI